MKEKIKVGIIKETKTPPDRRVAVPPQQGIELIKRFPNVELYIQKSDIRAFKDNEYTELRLNLTDDVSHCDILIGVKEVDIEALLPDKTYLFFAHVTKKQPHNQKLLKTIIEKGITLIDYELLTDADNMRLVAFGRWAGVVGAYNGLRAWGERTGDFSLKPAHECHDVAEIFGQLKNVTLPPIKILITGGGRVAHGAMETLEPLNLNKVTPEEFLTKEFDEPVFAQIDPWHYVERKDGEAFELQHFFDNPTLYRSTFLPYTKVTDILVACHFWDPKSPVFMTPEDMKADDFNIKVIADVSCDVNGPIPSTIRASTIAEPFFGYNPKTQKEGAPFDKNNITVMAVDNLPGEAPRDASTSFGKGLLEKIFPALFESDDKQIIHRATITKNGKLTEKYAYLQNFADGKE